MLPSSPSPCYFWLATALSSWPHAQLGQWESWPWTSVFRCRPPSVRLEAEGIFTQTFPAFQFASRVLCGGNPAEGQRTQVLVVLSLHASLLGREEGGESPEQLWRDKWKICSTLSCFLGKHTPSQGLTPGNGYRANLVCIQICTSACSCVHVRVYVCWLGKCKIS